MVHSYDQGEKRCTPCNKWFYYEGLYCPDCGCRLRGAPRYSPIAPSIVMRQKK